MFLRRLAYFVVACQQQGLAAAANELAITQSTLSAALKTLTDEIGVSLFEHVNRRLHPSRAGLWLFRSALPVLHAEEHARAWPATATGDQDENRHILVDVRLSFALGRVSKAVGRAIQRFTRDNPAFFAEPRFTDVRDRDVAGGDCATYFTPEHRSAIVIDALASGISPPRDGVEQIVLCTDPWVIVRSAERGASPSGRRTVIVPGLAEPLLRQLGDIATDIDQAFHIADAPAGALPRILRENGDAVILMPRSMAASRLDLEGLSIQPFSPETSSYIVAQIPQGDRHARALAEAIRDELAAPEQNLVFRPLISLRQFRYHQMLAEIGSITGAARRLSVAQPALTDQLKKLETIVGRRLFERSRHGLLPTSAGERFRRIGALMSERLREIDVKSVTQGEGEAHRLRLGIVPCSGPSSTLLHSTARAIDLWRDQNPSTRLEIIEGQSESLQAMITSGVVNLAIVDRNVRQFARVRLAEAEPLELIFDPRVNQPESWLSASFETVARLPLILPNRQSGLRQAIDEAAMRAGQRIAPRCEINSIPLLLELLRGRPYFSILPKGAVQSPIYSSELMALPISDLTIERQFYAIYSAERALTREEREFIGFLKAELEMPVFA